MKLFYVILFFSKILFSIAVMSCVGCKNDDCFKRGQFYKEANNCDSAVYYFKLGIVKENCKPCYQQIGECFFSLGELDSAYLYFDKAVENKSMTTDGYLILSDLMHYQNRLPELIFYLGAPQAYNTHDKRLLNEFALTLISLRSYQSALETLRDIAAIDSNYSEYYNSMGVNLSALDLDTLAIDSYTKAIELKPNSPIYYICRARSYAQIGLKKKAKRDYDKAIDVKERYRYTFVRRREKMLFDSLKSALSNELN